MRSIDGKHLRIAQLLPTLDIGGMERLTVDLARQQTREGHKAFIYCTRHAGSLACEAEANGVSVKTFGKRDGPSLSLVIALARQLKSDRIDILHAHNALVLHYGVAAARLAGVPVVVNTRHGGNMNWDAKCERIWRFSLGFVDSVVFVSQGVRNFYVEKDRLTSRNLSVIYNGIDVAKFRDQQCRTSGELTTFRFGSVGRLVPAKDHVTLVRAFHAISSALPQSELHLLGDGPCRNAIANTAAELGIAKRVFLHGAGLDVPGFLLSLDTFVLSSLDEGLPISLMEALAAGLPVVSTRLPGLVELAPESIVAGYCAPGQPQLLAELMLSTARRVDLPSLRVNSQRWAERFGIEQCWLGYQEAINKALRKKGLLP